MGAVGAATPRKRVTPLSRRGSPKNRKIHRELEKSGAVSRIATDAERRDMTSETNGVQ